MAIVAYTTKDINVETLASGIAVMDAYRATEKDFPKNFTSHSSVSNAEIQQGDAIKFTPDLSGLSVSEDIKLHRGGSPAYTIKLRGAQDVYQVLEQALEVQKRQKPKNGPRLDR